MDHHLEASSDGIRFDAGRLARSFEAVRRGEAAITPLFSQPGSVPYMTPLGPGPAERMIAPWQAAIINRQQKSMLMEGRMLDLPDVVIFETIAQRRRRTLSQFGYVC